MAEFTAQVLFATVRAISSCLGLLLLAISPFAFTGALASETMIQPSSWELLLDGLSFAIPGATLMVPMHFTLRSSANLRRLSAAYVVSLAVLSAHHLISIQAITFASLWLAMFVAVNFSFLLIPHRYYRQGA